MKIALAANNGEIGGGEVMLLALARSAEDLGHEVMILGPESPSSLIDMARSEGFNTTALRAGDRKIYMGALRRWRAKHRDVLLWCNGLLPAVATSGMNRRVVHLHQNPSPKLRGLLTLARWNSEQTIVPSTHMASKIKGATVLPNWSSQVETSRTLNDSDEIEIGFIGRFSSDKGLPILIDAVNQAQKESHRKMKLVLAGEPRFVGDSDKKKVLEAIHESAVSIRQIGWVPPSEFFSSVDFVVVPSAWQEPFGLVATECMSAQVPLIVTDAGALPEIVGEGYPWIAKAGDSNSLRSVLLGALNSSSEHIQGAVLQSYQRWQKLFSPEAGHRALDSILTDIKGA